MTYVHSFNLHSLFSHLLRKTLHVVHLFLLSNGRPKATERGTACRHASGRVVRNRSAACHRVHLQSALERPKSLTFVRTMKVLPSHPPYRGTSLIRKRPPP